MNMNVVFLRPKNEEPKKGDKDDQFGFDDITPHRMDRSKTADPPPPAQAEVPGGWQTKFHDPKPEIWFFD